MGWLGFVESSYMVAFLVLVVVDPTFRSFGGKQTMWLFMGPLQAWFPTLPTQKNSYFCLVSLYD